MTTDEIIAKEIANGNDAAADAAYELWKGERKPELVENEGEDWVTHPALLVLDGLKIPLTRDELNQMKCTIGFIEQEHDMKLSASHQSFLVDADDMDNAIQIGGME